MNLPTTAHFIYIPAMLFLGLTLGFIWGSRATREAIRLQEKRLEDRARKRADRAATATEKTP